MNSNMIETVNREYTDTLHHFTAVVNEKLVKFASQYYNQTLSSSKIEELLNMDLTDKIWLVAQYEEELTAVNSPDLSKLY